MSSGFLEITRVLVPKSCADEAHAHLQLVGRSHFEGFALWAGVRSGSDFHVRKTLVPRQAAHASDLSVCVSVDGDELHRMNVWLYQHGFVLVAQLHSHPQEAYHSETDNEYPIVATIGAFSLVLPDFAKHPFSLETTAVYRLMEHGWKELSAVQVMDTIVIQGE
jgi:hypothetical protein